MGTSKSASLYTTCYFVPSTISQHIVACLDSVKGTGAKPEQKSIGVLRRKEWGLNGPLTTSYTTGFSKIRRGRQTPVPTLSSAPERGQRFLRSLWLNSSKKQVYLRHRCFLPYAYRKMKQQFDCMKETSLALRHFNGKYVYNQVKDINVTFGKNHKPWRKKSTILGKRKQTMENDDKKRWKKKSIFWELPYWIYLDVRHN